ncbi:MAG: UDP-N-acetylmuramoyl-tripeptide--D-alanyl-D-alanine ligase [Cyclobacteriaceae bacterium]
MQHLIELLYAKFLQSNGVSIDTRSLKEGQMFLAFKGPNFNGNLYARQAITAGASYAVIDDPQFTIKGRTILVDDTLEALQALARFHRARLRCPFLGITGSNGKTTTKELVSAVLQKKFIIYATRGNLNNHIGVPLTILEINPQTEFAIIEMGASAVGEIALLSDIARPTMGMITNIGRAHTETFGGVEGVIRGKSELFDFLRKHDGKAFVNQKDKVLQNMTKRFDDPVTYPGEDMELLRADPFINYRAAGKSYDTRLIGSYNFPNMAAAVAVGRYMGVDENAIHEAISNYSPDNNRSEITENKVSGNVLVKDAYNANPDSMKAAIENFAEMSGYKVAILGDMNELDNPEEAHAELGKLLERLEIDEVIFCGDLTKTAYENCRNSIRFDKVQEITEYIGQQNWKNSKILLKGSRSIGLEKLFPILEGKGTSE